MREAILTGVEETTTKKFVEMNDLKQEKQSSGANTFLKLAFVETVADDDPHGCFPSRAVEGSSTE